MARIPDPDPATLDEKTRARLSDLAPLNIFRTLAHAGPALGPFVDLGTAILFRGELDPVLREIAIIRVGVLSGSAYEVFQHERIGRGLGMADTLIEAIRRDGADPVFDDLQELVMFYTDDVVRNVKPADSLFEPLLEALGPRALAELTLAIGYYMMVCRMLETFEVEIEPDADPDADPLKRGT